MHIDWASLAAVGVVAAAAAVTVVLLVSFAVVGLSTRAERRGGPDGDRASGTHPGVGTAVAVLCLFAAGLIVCYGLYVIIA
jgi:hypothetical protein